MEHPLEIESFDEMRHISSSAAAGPQNGHGISPGGNHSPWNDHILGQNTHPFTPSLDHETYGLSTAMTQEPKLEVPTIYKVYVRAI